MSFEEMLEKHGTLAGLGTVLLFAFYLPVSYFTPALPFDAGVVFISFGGTLGGATLLYSSNNLIAQKRSDRLSDLFGEYKSEEADKLADVVSEAESLRDDTVQSIAQEVQKITDVNGKAVERFNRATKQMEQKQKQLGTLISQLEDRMISEKQWKVIRRIVGHYQNGSYETMADAVGELSRSIGEVRLPDEQ